MILSFELLPLNLTKMVVPLSQNPVRRLGKQQRKITMVVDQILISILIRIQNVLAELANKVSHLFFFQDLISNHGPWFFYFERHLG